jgi:hypothetical protein
MHTATAAANPATAAFGPARVIVLVSVLGLAGVVGLAAGAALNERSAESQTINGYPPGWHGGAAIPASRTATSIFSVEALDAVRATRGDAMAPATEVEQSDHFQRHPQLTGPKATRIPANAE